MLDPLTAAEEICKIFPVNRRSAYKLFKLGLAAVFVISKLHSNRSEQGFSGFHMANNFQPIRLLIYGSYDYFQSLQNILIVKSKQVESCDFYVPFYTLFWFVLCTWFSFIQLYCNSNCFCVQTNWCNFFILTLFYSHAFFEEVQLASVNIDTILCIVSVFRDLHRLVNLFWWGCK